MNGNMDGMVALVTGASGVSESVLEGIPLAAASKPEGSIRTVGLPATYAYDDENAPSASAPKGSARTN